MRCPCMPGISSTAHLKIDRTTMRLLRIDSDGELSLSEDTFEIIPPYAIGREPTAMRSLLPSSRTVVVRVRVAMKRFGSELFGVAAGVVVTGTVGSIFSEQSSDGSEPSTAMSALGDDYIAFS